MVYIISKQDIMYLLSNVEGTSLQVRLLFIKLSLSRLMQKNKYMAFFC